MALTQRFVDEVVLVSDNAIIEALAMILEQFKILTEPSGAASFAGLLSRQIRIPSGANVVCVLSGGNVDRADLKRMDIL